MIGVIGAPAIQKSADMLQIRHVAISHYFDLGFVRKQVMQSFVGTQNIAAPIQLVTVQFAAKRLVLADLMSPALDGRNGNATHQDG